MPLTAAEKTRASIWNLCANARQSANRFLRISISAEEKFLQLRLADDVADGLDDVVELQADVAALEIFFEAHHQADAGAVHERHARQVNHHAHARRSLRQLGLGVGAQLDGVERGNLAGPADLPYVFLHVAGDRGRAAIRPAMPAPPPRRAAPARG